MRPATHITCPNRIEFYFPDLDNHVLVENLELGTVVRATRDNFPEKRKNTFIRNLAAEGLVPDHCGWIPGENSGEFRSVIWVIDDSWVGLDPRVFRRARRNLFRVVLISGLLWLLLLFGVLGTHHG